MLKIIRRPKQNIVIVPRTLGVAVRRIVTKVVGDQFTKARLAYMALYYICPPNLFLRPHQPLTTKIAAPSKKTNFQCKQPTYQLRNGEAAWSQMISQIVLFQLKKICFGYKQLSFLSGTSAKSKLLLQGKARRQTLSGFGALDPRGRSSCGSSATRTSSTAWHRSDTCNRGRQSSRKAGRTSKQYNPLKTQF